MHEDVAKLEPRTGQLAWMCAPMDKRPIVRALSECFGDRSKLLYEIALSPLLKRKTVAAGAYVSINAGE